MATLAVALSSPRVGLALPDFLALPDGLLNAFQHRYVWAGLALQASVMQLVVFNLCVLFKLSRSFLSCSAASALQPAVIPATQDGRLLSLPPREQ